MNSEPVSAEIAALLEHCNRSQPWAEQDEGPYYRAAQPERRDLVEDREGVQLQLGVRLTDVQGTPLRDAPVEIWHCDAFGRYSGFPPPSPAVVAAPGTESTPAYLPEESFLRGRQATDSAGRVEFRTVYPGWYPGRTLHIHLAAHTPDAVLITQLYFPDEITNVVLARPPYQDRPGRDTTNSDDEILPTGGDPAMLDVTSVAGRYRAATWLLVAPWHT